jgi:uncharacterized protein (DUF1786 family)
MMNTATVATALFVKSAAYALVMETVKTKVAGKRLLRRRVMPEIAHERITMKPASLEAGILELHILYLNKVEKLTDGERGAYTRYLEHLGNPIYFKQTPK